MPLDPWAEQAACKDAPTNWFFPDREDNSDTCYNEARKLCATCPVRNDCVDHALVNEPFGMWGGLTPRQRTQERRRRRAEGTLAARSSRCGTRSGYERHRKLGEPACVDCRLANATKATKRGAA